MRWTRGGRWNAKNAKGLVYAATTPELCFLEYMVHLEGTPLADLPYYPGNSGANNLRSLHRFEWTEPGQFKGGYY
ncbi:RES family NAD+ phosphorylase [Larkinella soli]|uniref:RES family NAD+ phosphorylase n=1 Tax=Larkinella soli TaxID=1770527 RepID=UPI001E476610|nr:RES family NAD+ phosphorylase [Larkinella soli]